MTKREYLLWLQAKRNQHPGVTMQPSRPGPYGEPQWASFGGRPAWMDQQQVPAKDITTVIKEYEGDTPNTKTTTIKGGLLGDPTQDWDGRGAEHDERGMQDWYAHMAQARNRQQTGGAAPSQAQVEESLGRYGDFRREQFTPPPIGVSSPQRARTRLPQPAQVPTPANVHRRQGAGDRRFQEFVPPNVRRIPPGIKYPPHASGALPPPENRPVDTGSSIADARMAAIAEANQFEADEARASHQAAQQRLAKSEAPVDYGQDDPREADEAEERRRQAMARSAYPDMRIDQKSVEGTIYGEASTGQKIVANVLGLSTDLYRRSINSLLMFLGAEEDDDILIETDPTKWIEKKLQENPYLIRDSKKFLLDTIKGGASGVAKIAGETVDYWGGELDSAAEAIGAENKASIPGVLIDDAKDYWKPKVVEMDKKYKDWSDRVIEGAAAIERGPDDPALLYDDPRRRAAQAAREKLPRMGIGRGPDLPDPSGVPKTEAEEKAADKSQKKREADAGTAGTTSATDNKNELRNNPQLAAMWGKYAYDPAARKKVYLDNLKQVYKKALMLDIIAQLTGGQSRSKEYLKMATTKLDAVDQFDQEQRVSNIWKQVFTGTNGQFYMPKDKREAAERAHFFGGDPKTVANIFGSVPEKKGKVQYYRPNPKDPTNKWEVIRSSDDPGPTYIAGTPPRSTPSGDKLLADKKMDRYNELLSVYETATGDGKVVALRNLENWASFAKLKTGGMTEQQNRTFAEGLWKIYFTEDEALLPGAPDFLEFYHGTGKFVMPKDDTGRKVSGWGAPGGGQTAGGETKELKSFNTEAEAEAAIKAGRVDKGELIIIKGREARA